MLVVYLLEVFRVRTLVMVVLGLVLGFVAGMVASEIIGIVGFLAFDRLVGIRFLPLISAVVGALAAPALDRRSSRS
jgi:hypothetical protein